MRVLGSGTRFRDRVKFSVMCRVWICLWLELCLGFNVSIGGSFRFRVGVRCGGQ